jgi:hypothetical protein
LGQTILSKPYTPAYRRLIRKIRGSSQWMKAIVSPQNKTASLRGRCFCKKTIDYLPDQWYI